MKMSKKLTTLEVERLVDLLYAKSAVGCCLHIVLDDGNVNDSHVEFCIKYALEQKHNDCYALALILLTMSTTQRIKLYNGD